MRVLGIDPGTSLIGYGIIDAEKSKYGAVLCGAFRTPSNIPNRERVAAVFDFFLKLIKKHKPDVVAIESLFYFKNAKTVIAVSEVRGVLLLAAAHCGVSVSEHTPLQVKQAVSGYGKAEKAQVQEMVRIILGLRRAPHPDDVADALALAICAANTVQYDT